jgi:hypothetical protein
MSTIISLLFCVDMKCASHTQREEHRLRVLRAVFGPKRENVTGGWRNMHNVGSIICIVHHLLG